MVSTRSSVGLERDKSTAVGPRLALRERPESTAMGSPRYVETIEAVDALAARCHEHCITPDEFTTEITDVFYEYLIEEDPRDDISGLVDYCVQAALEVCELTLFGDRVLPQRLDHQLRWILEQQGEAVSLAHLLRQLRARLAEGDEVAKLELVELCQHGYESHQELFSAVDSEQGILELAHEYRVVPALDAAVRPVAPGRLASEDKSRGFALPRTLDLIAHLAADPIEVSGTLARDSLVELCSYPETAGAAALRIPVHLLSADQRARLFEIYEAQEASLGPDVVQIFIPEQQLRDREILRSALWQANDATRMSVAEPYPPSI